GVGGRAGGKNGHGKQRMGCRQWPAYDVVKGTRGGVERDAGAVLVFGAFVVLMNAMAPVVEAAS
ncbi:UNVERIFIED_CONTAM: hypothetical protein NY603_38195, partial [Bacteroidetes bacterium 56_B9]